MWKGVSRCERAGKVSTYCQSKKVKELSLATHVASDQGQAPRPYVLLDCFIFVEHHLRMPVEQVEWPKLWPAPGMY